MPYFFCFFCLANASAENPSTNVDGGTVTVYGKRTSDSASDDSEVNSTKIPIEVRGAETLSDRLKNNPSIDVRDSGGQGAVPNFFIRGQDPKQARFFLEGFPLTDGEFNGSNVTLIPVSALSQAEIFPQGVPIMLLDDGMGGAVNFSLSPLNEKVTELGARAGSYQYLNATGSLALKNLGATVDTDYTQSLENYVYYDDNGTPYNASDDTLVTRSGNQFQRALLLPRFEKELGFRSRLRAFSLNAYSRTQIPGAIALPTNGILSQYFQLNGIRLKSQLTPQLNLDAAVFSRFDFQTLNFDRSDFGLTDSNSRALTLGLRARLSAHLNENFEFETAIGGGWQNYYYRLQASPQSPSAPQKLELPFGLALKINLGSWMIKSSLGGHLYQYAAEGIDNGVKTSYLLISPRLGTTVDVSEVVQIHGELGSYYRSPSMYELYGAPNGVNPNPALNYEQSYQASGGTRFKFDSPLRFIRSIKATYDFFVSRSSNLITFVQNSPQTQIATNIGESLILGHEIASELRFESNIKFQLGLSLLNTTNLTPVSYQLGKELPGRPPYRINATLGYELQRIGFGYTLAVTGPMFWEVSNLKLLAPIWDHGAYAFWDARSFGTFTFEVRNIADVITAQSYFGNQSVLDNTTAYYGYPAPGRRFYLSWRYAL